MFLDFDLGMLGRNQISFFYFSKLLLFTDEDVSFGSEVPEYGARRVSETRDSKLRIE